MAMQVVGARAPDEFLKNQAVEFAVAGAVVLVVFVLSIDRAVMAYLLGH